MTREADKPETAAGAPGVLRDVSKARIGALADAEVLILGGGVNGVATLRELALNGVSCVLLDHGDYASGASGASSRMAHGGLRYLEGREFRLVAESARERNRLIANAGHIVKPLKITVPLEHLVSGLVGSVSRFLGLSRRSGPLSLAALEGALRLYEAYGRREHPLPAHQTMLRRDRFPEGLSPRTRAVVTYYDGQITQPEGLMFEMISEAMAQGPHVAVLNHATWHRENGQFIVGDRFSGEVWRLAPKVVVNATGAAIDKVNAQLGGKTRYLRGVKGAHLVLDNPELHARMNGHAFYFDDGTGRMIITLPVGDNVLAGTTEVETDDPEDRYVAEGEIDYLLQAMDGLFSDIPVTSDQIVSMTTGIRPLRRGDGSVTSAARDHALEENIFAGLDALVLSLVGGKWTTFRAFGEEAADRALSHLGRRRKVSTTGRRYPGAAPCFADDIVCETGVTPQLAERLLTRYGAMARAAARSCTGAGATPLTGAPEYCHGEIVWAIRERGAQRIEDIVLRRSRLTFGQGLRDDTLTELARILQAETGRPRADITAEVKAIRADPRLMGMRTRSGEDAA
ncbi:glycerol-3-phosphate dehydrogenase/oxidase [Salipiger bermudensis]|uniref:glycerol-3-phosphate dehydrogenase/oxidase n=1 Tax=Salipiger bermudensis TaxID=344736 RepID=UPI001C999AE0|nr:glycerol-3-phosphate dehydrogenase/oxidase [Salipiger bermudensis]MBY6003278.1 glycerol-3-phosphate dehydrogenase/oxidase [Salipiger bermudensis]